MNQKSPDAFRTISEVAEDLDLPQHVLRFWETRFSQIKPLKRGGNRRYYRPEDVDLLRGIRHLLYGEGYTIRGVQRILKEQGVRRVAGIWKEAESGPVSLRRTGAETATDDGAPDDSTKEAVEPAGTLEPVAAAESAEAVAGTAAPETDEAGAGPAPSAPAHSTADAGAPAFTPARTSAEVDKLRRALMELAECRRILQDARTR